MAALCADQPALHLTLRLTAAGAAATQVFWASDQQLTPACSLHSLPLQPDKPRLLADLVSAAAFRMLLALPVRILVPAAGLHYAEPPSFGGLRASQAGVQPNEPGVQPHLVSAWPCLAETCTAMHAQRCGLHWPPDFAGLPPIACLLFAPRPCRPAYSPTSPAYSPTS